LYRSDVATSIKSKQILASNSLSINATTQSKQIVDKDTSCQEVDGYKSFRRKTAESSSAANISFGPYNFGAVSKDITTLSTTKPNTALFNTNVNMNMNMSKGKRSVSEKAAHSGMDDSDVVTDSNDDESGSEEEGSDVHYSDHSSDNVDDNDEDEDMNHRSDITQGKRRLSSLSVDSASEGEMEYQVE
jgi:hypothetical protein